MLISAVFFTLLLVFSPIHSYQRLSNDYELEFVSTVFRHGDRSPVTAFPNSEYQESFWPQGFGQLSITGMQQEYHLGELYRNLYIDTGFINRNYSRRQVYIRSTDYDRTLMSGESMLVALFPPDDDEKFNPDIPWQPIPVHTVPRDSDTLLYGYAVDCPEYDRQRELDESTEEYKKLEEDNRKLFDQLEEWTGTEHYEVANAWSIYDELFVEQSNNLTMPSWYTDDLLFNHLMPLQYYTMYLFSNTPIKKKITGGLWANEVITNMKNKAGGQEDMKDLKAVIYSSHDTTVSIMLSVFDLYNGMTPPYSAAFSVELYSKENEYFVKFRYRNDTYSDEFHDLKHPDCSQDPCPLDELARIMESYMITEEERETLCQLDDSSGKHSSLTTVLSVVLGVCGFVLVITLVAMVIVLIGTIRQRRRILKYQKLSVAEDT